MQPSNPHSGRLQARPKRRNPAAPAASAAYSVLVSGTAKGITHHAKVMVIVE